MPVRSGVGLLAALLLASLIAGPAAAQEQEAQQPSRIPVNIGIILPAAGDQAGTLAAVREAADQGLAMAGEELGFNAEILGFDLNVTVADADDAEQAGEAARRLVAEGEVIALAGGYGDGVAEAIARVAVEARVPFLNIGSPSISLRNEQCSIWTFHIEPSAGMYLDAIAGWYVAAGFRDWHLVLDGSEEGEMLARRFERTLRERHFAARVTGRSSVADRTAAEAIAAGRNADVIVLLTRAEQQLELLAASAEAGVEAEVIGFPWPDTQTREFYFAAAEAAPSLQPHRATVWEPTLDAYGARELNARFEARYGELMDSPAWAAYQAVKLVLEGFGFGGVRDAESLQSHFSSDSSVFDVWKGIGVTFRPWNNQLRQSLFLVQLRPGTDAERDVALLVGELPAIYMPRTDPVERLDQLGDTAQSTGCRF